MVGLETTDQVQSGVRPLRCRNTGDGPLWRYASRAPIIYAVYDDQPFTLGIPNDLLIRVP